MNASSSNIFIMGRPRHAASKNASHRVVSAGVRCSFESGHKQDDHALTLRAISGSMHRKKMYRVSLFDHLVGAAKQWQRDREAECPRGLEINDQLDSRFLLDRHFGLLFALEHSPGVPPREAI